MDQVIEFLGSHEKLGMMLKILFLGGATVYSFLSLGPWTVELMKGVHSAFGLTMTEEMIGTVWAFSTALLPSLLVPPLFIDEVSQVNPPVQMREHAKVLATTKLERSSLTRSVRQFYNPECAYAQPQRVATRLQAVLMLVPSYAWCVTVSLAYQCFILIPLLGFIGLFYLSSYALLVGVVGSALWRIYRYFQSVYSEWRGFWGSYWRLLYVRTAPLDEAVEFTLNGTTDIPVYSSSDHSTHESFLNAQLDREMEYPVDAQALCNSIGSNMALDIARLHNESKHVVATNEAILSNEILANLLKTSISKLDEASAISNDLEYEAYCRLATIVIEALDLADTSVEAVKDLLELPVRESNRSALFEITCGNMLALDDLPNRVWPDSLKWLLVAYSLATTIGLVLGSFLANLFGIV